MLDPIKNEQEKRGLVFENRVAAIHRLRVNVKSLAAEAKIIRAEEQRASHLYRSLLSAHRRGQLRDECRYANLALAYVRGRAYKSVEGPNSKRVDANRLAQKVARHTGFVKTFTADSVIAWVS